MTATSSSRTARRAGWVSVREAASILGISTERVRELLTMPRATRSHALPPLVGIRLDRDWAVRLDTVAARLAAKVTQEAAAGE